MRHLVVGTAGHIDHGKSALVAALTGVHPDRLEEEQRRGITIDLGFADCDMGDDGVLSFVDVPGHERFVRHMVAGASGLDAVLLIVAADDGVKPQTREHLAICSLLGLEHGLVVLTKSDLVDADVQSVVGLEVREFLAGTFLAEAPILPVSSKTGEGLDVLRSTLRGWLRAYPPRASSGIARLPIDRSFVLKGFGTVVTGTLVSGRLAEGDEIEILPGGRRGRVRGLQVHKHKVAEASAGRRLAVNIQGLDCDEAPRGATLTTPSALETTRRARVTVELLPSAPEAMRRGGPIRFHQGTCERAARLRILGTPGDEPWPAELRFAQPTVLLPGDRFILRRPSPVDTVGGGVVVDAHPAATPRAAKGLTGATFENAWQERIARRGAAGRSTGSLSVEMGRSPSETETAVSALISAGRVRRAGGLLFSIESWDEARRAVVEALRAFHDAEPLVAGMAREPLRTVAVRAMPAEAFRDLLTELQREDTIRVFGERVAAADHRVVLSTEDTARAGRIEEAFRRAGIDPPPVPEVLRQVGGDNAARLCDYLVAAGRLVRIRDGRLFHTEALEDVRRRLREFSRTSATIEIGAFKDLVGATRKNAIPLLEQFDEERLTRREGNVRRILTNDAAH